MSWLKVGKVGRARGLRGAFYISGRDETFPPEYNPIVIGDSPENGAKTSITDLSVISGRSCIECDISKNRETAEKLTGQPIWVKESAIKVNDETEYLWSDVAGRVVYDVDGELLGKVRSLYNSGANDIAIIDDTSKTVELPFIAAYFDMSFTTGGDKLQLTVKNEVFEDLWIDRREKNK